ncbi:hypothetical protein B0H13DRAFT_1966517 [Mycena leptocephala]|nr:hypothetical protein B0H13DRAFT_1966517 [Mycena leptocephala]
MHALSLSLLYLQTLGWDVKLELHEASFVTFTPSLLICYLLCIGSTDWRSFEVFICTVEPNQDQTQVSALLLSW